MSGPIPIVLLGILILIFSGRLLVQWNRRSHTKAVTIEDYSRARAALDSVFVETESIKRIFASEDLEFISRTGTRKVQRFFLKERKCLAIQWLRMTQRQVSSLMDIHLKLSSYTYEPSPRFEIALTVNYLCFILVSNVLLVLFWLSGPFETVKILGYTLRATEHFCSAFSLRLEKTDALKLGAAVGSRRI